jgi:hypothetical protein
MIVAAVEVDRRKIFAGSEIFLFRAAVSGASLRMTDHPILRKSHIVACIVMLILE